MKKKVNINDRGVDTAGITKDYKEAVAELMWNSFDANASEINIDFNANALDHINSISIKDNGDGIPYENIDKTFGSFLDSVKRISFQRSSYIKGKKGKGRFAFTTFAGTASWDTTYKKDGSLVDYTIKVTKNNKDVYDCSDRVASTKKKTGTTLELSDLFHVTGYSFSSQEFIDFLCREFGWFLFLNKSRNYQIRINKIPIQYEHIIAESDEREIVIAGSSSEKNKFKISFLRWNEPIGDKYFFYYLNEKKKEQGKILTSFNNQAIDFHHSVFVESTYFNDFDFSDSEPSLRIVGKGKGDPVFRALQKALLQLLDEKRKKFVHEVAANKLIQKYERNGILPAFKDNQYDQERKKDLVNAIKEIYSVQPRIFVGLNEEQERTCVGFLNLILDTDERDGILSIMESVTKLTSDERIELVGVLKRSRLSNIIKTIKLIENRFKVVEMLKALVFDLTKFTNERDHIQKVVEENYWLFGEQYHLASADENFEKLLSQYLYILDGVDEKKKMGKDSKRKRPDVFMLRKRNIPDTFDPQSVFDDNIMVELKRPSVEIGVEQYRQVENYKIAILKEPQFNSQTRIWKFYLVGLTVNDYIKGQYTAFKDRHKRYLVHESGNFEIYAMTWDDVFRTFEINHKYLLEKLDFDKQALLAELASKGIKFDERAPEKITREIIKISPRVKVPVKIKKKK